MIIKYARWVTLCTVTCCFPNDNVNVGAARVIYEFYDSHGIDAVDIEYRKAPQERAHRSIYCDQLNGTPLAWYDGVHKIIYLDDSMIQEIEMYGSLSLPMQYALLYRIGLLSCSNKINISLIAKKFELAGQVSRGGSMIAFIPFLVFIGQVMDIEDSNNHFFAYNENIPGGLGLKLDYEWPYKREHIFREQKIFENMAIFYGKAALLLGAGFILSYGIRDILKKISSYQKEHCDIYKRAKIFAANHLGAKKMAELDSCDLTTPCDCDVNQQICG